MGDTDLSVSLADDDDDFEKFLQEPLSSDVPSSSESVTSKDKKKLWWMDKEKSKEKEAEKSKGGTWLKNKSEPLAIEDSQEKELSDVKVDSESGDDPMNSTQKDIHSTEDKKLYEVETSEEELVVKEQLENGSQYSDTFQSSSSTGKVAEPEETDGNILPFDQEKSESADTSGDEPSNVEQKEENELCVTQLVLANSKTLDPSSLKVTTEHTDHLLDYNQHDDVIKMEETIPKTDFSNVSLISEKETVDSEKNYETNADLNIKPKKHLEDDNYVTNLKQENEKLLNDFLKCQKIWEKEKNENKALKAQLEASEKDMVQKLHEERLEYEQEKAAIKKDNVILMARLEQLELQKKGSKNEELLTADISFLKEQIIHLQKEVQDQERLLQGYQQENERLYTELKSVQKAWKITENKLKNQNAHLMGEVSRLREQIHTLERASSFKLQMSNSDKGIEESALQFEGSMEENSPSYSNKQIHRTFDERLIEKYEGEIKQLLELSKKQDEERSAFKIIHMQDIKVIEELHVKVKSLEDLLEASKENYKETKKIASNKQIVEHDADMAKMKKLQSEVAVLQHKLKEMEQDTKDIIKLHTEEIKMLKVDNKRLTSELEGSRLEIQTVQSKNKDFHLQLQMALEENKILEMHVQRKVSRMSKAIQTLNFPDKKRSDVVLENKELKLKMEKLETEKKDLETKVLIIKAETEKMLEIEQQEREYQLKQLKKAHAADVQKIISDMAAQHSTSKVAELMNRLQSQEIILGQLNEKTKELKEMENQMDLQRIVNSDLEVEIRELRIELNKAKSQQTPLMRDVFALQEEIRELEKRQHRREEELQYLMLKLKNTDTKYLKQEVSQWQQRVIEKNEELEYFRSELNTILLFLEQLERQGITIPPLKSMEKDTVVRASGENRTK